MLALIGWIVFGLIAGLIAKANRTLQCLPKEVPDPVNFSTKENFLTLGSRNLTTQRSG